VERGVLDCKNSPLHGRGAGGEVKDLIFLNIPQDKITTVYKQKKTLLFSKVFQRNIFKL
jgi:hypothetical protein